MILDSVRVGVGTFFVVSALAKAIGGIRNFTEDISEYRLLPHRLAPALAASIPAIELLAGAALVAGILIAPSAAILTGLITVFNVAAIISIRRGYRHACGCLGDLTARPVGWNLVAQNFIVICLLVASAVAQTSGGPAWSLMLTDWPNGAFTVLAGAALAMLILMWTAHDSLVSAFNSYRRYAEELGEQAS